MNEYSPENIATAVCSVFGGDPRNVLAGGRGCKSDFTARAVSMLIWRTQNWPRVKTYTEVGLAFGRDRRNVVRGLKYLENENIPTKQQYYEMLNILENN